MAVVLAAILGLGASVIGSTPSVAQTDAQGDRVEGSDRESGRDTEGDMSGEGGARVDATASQDVLPAGSDTAAARPTFAECEELARRVAEGQTVAVPEGCN